MSDRLSQETRKAIATAKVKPRVYPPSFSRFLYQLDQYKKYLRLPRGSAGSNRVINAYANVRLDVAGGYTLEEIRQRHSHLQQLNKMLRAIRDIEPELWALLGTQSDAPTGATPEEGK